MPRGRAACRRFANAMVRSRSINRAVAWERPLTWRPVRLNCSSIPSCEHADAGKTGVISLLASPWGKEAVVVLRVHPPLSQACLAQFYDGKQAGTLSIARCYLSL